MKLSRVTRLSVDDAFQGCVTDIQFLCSFSPGKHTPVNLLEDTSQFIIEFSPLYLRSLLEKYRSKTITRQSLLPGLDLLNQ